MRLSKALRGIVLAAVTTVGVLLMSVGSAAAAGGTKLCVPTAENTAVVTPTAGACKSGYTLTELGAEGKEGKEGKAGSEGKAGKEGKEGKAGAEGKAGKEGKEGKEGTFAGLTAVDKETLLAVLPCIKFIESGIDKKPTVQFSGCNVQIVSGGGKTNEANGEGNPDHRL
jgi:hypothetical protein